MIKFLKWLWKKLFGKKTALEKEVDKLKEKAKLTFKQRIARMRLNYRVMKEKKRKASALHIEKVKARTAERNRVRKELGKKEGVNWKRIVLMSKVVNGKVTDYFIKKHAVRSSTAE